MSPVEEKSKLLYITLNSVVTIWSSAVAVSVSTWAFTTITFFILNCYILGSFIRMFCFVFSSNTI